MDAGLTIVDLGGFCWSLTLFSAVFCMSFDCKGLFITDIDGDILLLGARKFAFENVLVFLFFEIKFRHPRSTRAGVVGDALELIESVIEKVEEWSYLTTSRAKGCHAWEE